MDKRKTKRSSAISWMAVWLAAYFLLCPLSAFSGDIVLDADNDGIDDALEVQSFGTDPNSPDTDVDGVKDGLEIGWGADPLDAEIVPRFMEPLSEPERASEHGGYPMYPRAVWNGSGFAAVWEACPSGCGIYWSDLGGAGSEASGEVLVTRDGYFSSLPDMVWNGEEYGIVWQDWRDGNWEIYFAAISPEGERLTGDIRVTYSRSYSLSPSLAWTGSDYGLVWRERVGGKWSIFFARLSVHGFPLTPAIAVGNPPDSPSRKAGGHAPEIAYGGAGFGVVWSEGYEGAPKILFARVTDDGGVTAPVAVSGGQGGADYPDIAWNGSYYGVVWEERREEKWAAMFGLVDLDGSIFAGPREVISGEGYVLEPALAWSGDFFGVATTSEGEDGFLCVEVAQVSPGGMVMGPVYRASPSGADAGYPGLAYGDESMALVWEDYRSGWDIYSGFVDFDQDVDGDGILDRVELRGVTDPMDMDTDDDGRSDGIEDKNHNGVVDPGESDPLVPDAPSMASSEEGCQVHADKDGGHGFGCSMAGNGASSAHTLLFMAFMFAPLALARIARAAADKNAANKEVRMG